MTTVFESLKSIFNSVKGMDYIGEAVSQETHALQCAYFAKTSGASDEVVIASLLHDIGHYLSSIKLPEMDGLGIVNHEWIAARYLLEKGFSEKVAKLVGYHVAAKRYLAGKKQTYYERLSPASKGTLEFQGGPMSEAEIIEFEKLPEFREILQVRVNDEKGKEINLAVPDFDAYQSMIEANLIMKQIPVVQEKTVYFVRHAEATGQAPDCPLTEKGQHDVSRVTEFFLNEQIDIVLTSPFLRAKQTITPLAELQKRILLPDYRLAEQHPCLDFSNPEYEAHAKRSFEDVHYAADGGVAMTTLFNYISDLIQDIRESVLSHYVVVSHGRWLSALQKWIDRDVSYEEAQKLTRPDILKLTIDRNGSVLERVNF